ncbi:MAG: cation transporter [Roseivirga sp.]|jgi:copper chaperone CopZ|uniref:heavy-metal-associated domain-containing protein n=1 Tax=Roseivirga sp. TaxID=1964215 RepID=UPI001B03EE93|nr:MauE/DoxX family redox-associated membrane protein [Roseivirga sp.]MBO6662357.1 cation transporter [Roseivirga sp.]MBO6759494.1 cation transporter [Roseivirga sp.]MBO6910301.1 cation transporter [Roseivirga sp.]
MKKQITITRMTCEGCKAKVTRNIQKLEGVKSVEIDLTNGKTIIDSDALYSETEIQDAIGRDSKYQIVRQEPISSIKPEEEQKSFFSTYKPLLLIAFFIILISTLTQYPFDSFNGRLWMRHFMAGFFIVFSFFKLLNIQGFSNSYKMYDIIAKKWSHWGKIYPFVELALGIAYLINIYPTTTNLITVIVLGASSIGVIKSNLDKKKIKCACLGDVFNLPMSKVTIIEDVTMVAMAAVMLL